MHACIPSFASQTNNIIMKRIDDNLCGFLLFFCLHVRVDVKLARLVFFLGSVEGSPDGRSNKETHRLDVISFVAGEPVVASLGKGHEISLFDPDADPLVLLVANVKVSGSVQDVTDFFGVVDVFLEKGLNLYVVSRQEVGADRNNVGIRVSAEITNVLELWVGRVLGVPWNGLGGIGILFSIHLPVGNAEILENFDGGRLVRGQSVAFLLVLVGTILHHVPGFWPLGVGGLGDCGRCRHGFFAGLLLLGFGLFFLGFGVNNRFGFVTHS
mmetsp:Transcript_14841/g.37370  ORF Transcript_14841/g.37370 Transcript_14841/m.37370 type:complete len:269 (+) Transcript_14841:156-962(+)